MQFKNNTKRGNVTIQGLRSFKDTLPKNVKKSLIRRVIFILKHLVTGDILLEMNYLKFVIQKHSKTLIGLGLVLYW